MKQNKKTVHMILGALFAALIAAGAFIKIPIPYVPLTLQTVFVLLSGMLLGKKSGALACLVYLAVGLSGLPVFTKGGGLMYLLEPSFGYILGFPLGAFLAGIRAEKGKNRSFGVLFLSAVCGLCGIYIPGILYLAGILRFYLETQMDLLPLLTVGVFAPLPADLIACALCAWVVWKVKPLVKNYI